MAGVNKFSQHQGYLLANVMNVYGCHAAFRARCPRRSLLPEGSTHHFVSATHPLSCLACTGLVRLFLCVVRMNGK